MTILGRNVRVPGGEIDILARDGDDLVFVEVRARRSSPGSAAESLHAPKLRRMWNCALAYCEAKNEDPEQVRIDVVSIDLADDGRVAAIEHFRGVEIPDGGSEW